MRFVSYNQIERDSIPQHLKKYCASIDIGHDRGDAANFVSSFYSILYTQNLAEPTFFKMTKFIKSRLLGIYFLINFVSINATTIFITRYETHDRP